MGALTLGVVGLSAGPAAAARPQPHCDTYLSMADTWNNLALDAHDRGDKKAEEAAWKMNALAWKWFDESGCG